MIKSFKHLASRVSWLFVLAFLISGCSYYTLSLQDFKKQFSDSLKFNRVYCTNKHNEVVWLETDKTILQVLKIDKSKSTDFYIYSTLFKNNYVTGQPVDAPSIRQSIPIDSILSVRLKVLFPKEVKYFDISERFEITQQKNDSINASCLSDNELVIVVKPLKGFDPSSDSIALCQNACYSVDFNDNVNVKYGIITLIKSDSLYITNSFNHNTAKYEKIDFKILKYSIKDIKAVRIYEGNGTSFISLKHNEYNFIPVKLSRMFLTCPYWYFFDEYSGEIWFYRNWRIQYGYSGIKEVNGKIYW